MKIKVRLIAMILLTAAAFVNCDKNYDLLITDAVIYDGNGGTEFTADIGIIGDKIADIGDLGDNALTVIDGKDLVVTPGFIDIHTHADRGFATGKEDLMPAKNYLMQGVTTLVTGNCGSGTFKVKEYFDKIEKTGAGTNVVQLVGHGSVRRNVMGSANAKPTPEQMEGMKALVRIAMEEGAAGMASGLFYSPGSYSETAEVIELAKELVPFDGFYASHIRDESNYSIGLEGAIKEAIMVGEEAGTRVQISHIKALGKPVWDTSTTITDIIEAAQKRGVNVLADQYPYVASSTSLIAATIPRWVQANGKMRELLTSRNDLKLIKPQIAENIERRGGPETLVISNFEEKKEWEGKSLAEISIILKKNAVDTAIELALMGGPGVVSFNMKDSDLLHFMKKEYIMTASDGSLPTFDKGVPHPRSYGTFTRKLKKYVLEYKILSMAQMVRSSSALPAEMINMTDRGKIEAGQFADIAVFDLSALKENSNFDKPHQYSEGIKFLIVNGKVVISDGEFNGTLAGKPIRFNQGENK